jgi:hypothetical protein
VLCDGGEHLGNIFHVTLSVDPAGQRQSDQFVGRRTDKFIVAVQFAKV